MVTRNIYYINHSKNETATAYVSCSAFKGGNRHKVKYYVLRATISYSGFTNRKCSFHEEMTDNYQKENEASMLDMFVNSSVVAKLSGFVECTEEEYQQATSEGSEDN